MFSVLIDLEGQRFGRLTVVGRAPNRGSVVMWECVCDCGGKKAVSSANLRNHRTKSCGCIAREMAWSTSPRDLVGQQFGHLTVISRNRTVRDSAWDCRCDCGNVSVVRHTNLVNGCTTSCGCRMRQKRDSPGQ